MSKFTFLIAMDVRVYGEVRVDAKDFDQATKKLIPDYIVKNFDPLGGSDDIDYSSPKNIYVMDDGAQNEAGSIDGFEGFEIPHDDDQGNQAIADKAKAFILELAALPSPEQERATWNKNPSFDYVDVEEMHADMENDELFKKYMVFKDFIIEAKTLASKL